jgi:FkbH-like protein
MQQEVRLLIWDLDETFWRGTLTEGGIEYIQRNHDIVVELARRGIMSSICSRNELAQVRAILQEHQLWDFFVFPSINWCPKGHRVRTLIQDVQLRSSTVMFIDDNPSNRAEISVLVPGIQVEDEHFLETILVDQRFRGKNDSSLTRLEQYKILERKNSDKTISTDNTAFLRQSQISVEVEFAVEKHLDRAIELINRTNQLNFTKKRLSEDPHVARSELRAELSAPNVQAGLVRVRDQYGDYGFSGFYLLHVHTWHLQHFCFSCRTMGMGVETWLYERLQRPKLIVAGEVLADLHAREIVVDWINVDFAQTQSNTPKGLGRRAFVSGGCEMQALAHYLSLAVDQVVSQFPYDRDGLPHPIQHSVYLARSLGATSPSEVASVASVGLVPEDFKTALVTGVDDFDFYVFSFWADAAFALYESAAGVLIPFGIHGLNNGADLRQLSESAIAEMALQPKAEKRLGALREHFAYRGWSVGSAAFRQNLCAIFEAIPSNRDIFVLLGCGRVAKMDGSVEVLHHFQELNRQTKMIASPFKNVRLVAPETFFLTPTDAHNATHFDRAVYYRIYNAIEKLRLFPDEVRPTKLETALVP